MPEPFISPEELLKSGVHFGHKVSRWNPKMRPYIYGKRNLIHIIDVRSTIKGLVKAFHFVEKLASKNEIILFVGTKRQAGPVIKEAAQRCGMPYVSERWIGGTLTNYATVRERLKRLEEIETWEKDGTINRYGKKEQSSIQREKRKLVRNLDGLRLLKRLPAALVVIDAAHEKIAVQEADKINPHAATIALIDTDGDPDVIDIPIPGNDDSMKVVQIVVNKLADAVVEGKAHADPVVEKPEEKPAVVSAGRDRDRRGRPPGFGGPGGGRGRGPGGGHHPGGPRHSAPPAPAAPAAPAPAAPQP
jgi:small subunit ribosomal protein S2